LISGGAFMKPPSIMKPPSWLDRYRQLEVILTVIHSGI